MRATSSNVPPLFPLPSLPFCLCDNAKWPPLSACDNGKMVGSTLSTYWPTGQDGSLASCFYMVSDNTLMDCQFVDFLVFPPTF